MLSMFLSFVTRAVPLSSALYSYGWKSAKKSPFPQNLMMGKVDVWVGLGRNHKLRKAIASTGAALLTGSSE